MKRKIELWDQAGYILDQVGKGVLMTTAVDGEVNTMTIGWGTMGIQWRKPIFIAFVRESRYTKELLDKNPEFTINIPYGEYEKSILSICGTRSGRDMDKIKELGLHLVTSDHVDVPGIKEFPLTLECKIIYKQKQDLAAIPADILARYYPEIPGADFDGQSRDYHYAYYGEIVGAYMIEE